MFVRLLVARLLALVAVFISCVGAEYFKYSGERSTLSGGEPHGRSVKEGRYGGDSPSSHSTIYWRTGYTSGLDG